MNKSVDLGRLEWNAIENLHRGEEVHTTDDVDDTSCEIAKQLELQKLCHFDTYEEVEDCGQKTISTRWVITRKDGDTRAGLVARGFEEHSLIPKDSPTVGKGAIRIFLTIVASRNWTPKTTDIKSAFLQGKKLDREVYIKPPLERETAEDFVWKLKHRLYGRKDGARQKFYMSVRDELLSLGFRQLKLDPAMFTLIREGSLIGIICCHVDDFLHAGNETFEAGMCKLRQRFLAGKIEEGNFSYIGFQITQNTDGIKLDHSMYMEKLDHPHIEPHHASQKQEQLNAEEQKLYRKLVGQLNWAVQGSRPDLAFELVDLSTKLKGGSVADLLRAIKNIGKLKDIKKTGKYLCSVMLH
jgi:hypothetical protein